MGEPRRRVKGIDVARLVAALLLAAPASSAGSEQAVGAINGSFSVGADGGATYNVGIRVPPGTGGMQPQLALSYDSREGNGMLGVGWQLSGLSAIQRCPATVRQDGFPCGVNYDQHDRFCLDGERLVNIASPTTDGVCHDNADDNYYQPGAIYHTEHESWRRIQSVDATPDGETCGNGPCAFVVTDSRGWTLEYGAPEDATPDPFGARVYDSEGAGVRVWSLNRVTDLHGNSMEISYTQAPLGAGREASGGSAAFPCASGSAETSDPSSTGYDFSPTEDTYPCRIDYTLNDDGGLPARRSVLFGYQARPDYDVLQSNRGGGIVQTSARLASVGTYVTAGSGEEESTVTTYALAFDDDTICSDSSSQRTTCRSRVASLTECGGDGLCFPPTVFSYQARELEFETLSESPLSTVGCESAPAWADFDGDGLTDWICSYGSEVTVQLGSSVDRDQPDDWAGSVITQDGLDECQAVQWSDFNGDGRDDWICFDGDTIQVYIFTDETVWSWNSTDDSDDIEIECSSSDTWQFTDVNSDGMTDWVCADVSGTYVLLSTGDGMEPPNGADSTGEIFVSVDGASTSIACEVAFKWVDFDGDGSVDATCNDTNTGGLWVLLSTGGGLADATDLPYTEDLSSGPAACASSDMTPHWVDFNGDGLQDWTCSTLGEPGFQVLLSTGRDLVASAISNEALGSWSCDGSSQFDWTDLNGDGMQDPTCWVVEGSGAYVSALVSTGSDIVSFADLGEDMDCGVPADWRDLTGEGLSNWLCTADTEVTVYVPAFTYPDLIVSIENGLGGEVHVEYLPLSDPDVYTPGDGDSDGGSSAAAEAQRLVNNQANDAYPLQEVESSLYVVREATRSDGRGNRYRYEYQYAGGLYDFQGRGWLGFETVTRDDRQLYSRQVTTYSQDFPFEGKPLSRELLCLEGSTDPGCAVVNDACTYVDEGGQPRLKFESWDYYCANPTSAGREGSCQVTPSDPSAGTGCWDDNWQQSDGSYRTEDPLFEPFACVYQALKESRRTDYYTYGCYDYSLGKEYSYGASTNSVVVPRGDGSTEQQVSLGIVSQQTDLNYVGMDGDDESSGDNVITSSQYYNLVDDEDWLIGFPTQQQVTSAAGDLLRQTEIYYDYPESAPGPDGCTPPDWSGYGGTMSAICQQKLASYQDWSAEDSACVDSETAARALSTTYSYDAFGNAVSVTDPAGNTTTTSFDSGYQTFPRHKTWPNGMTASYVYDAGLGKLLSTTDVNSNHFSHEYDSLGRRLADYGPNDGDQDYGSPTTLATYTWATDDVEGQARYYRQVDRSTDWDDASRTLWSRTYVDGLGRSYRTVAEGPDEDSNIVSSKSYLTPSLVATRTEPFYCDGTDCGPPIEDTEVCGTWDFPYTAFTYDAYGRTTQMLAPFGTRGTFQCTTSQWAYTDSATTTSTMAVGEPESTFQTVRYEYYDSIRRTAWSGTPFATGATECDPDSSDAASECSVTTFAYDVLGRVHTVTDPTGATTSYCYDSLDRLQSYVASDAFDFSYTWDADTPGQMTRRSDGVGQELVYGYDELNRVTSKTVVGSDQRVTRTITHTWDDAGAGRSANAIGRLTAVNVVEADEQVIDYTDYQYDSYGRRSEGTVALGPQLSPDGVARDYTFSTSRDPLGRPITHDNPDGSVVEFSFDDAGRLEGATMSDSGGAELAGVNYESYNALSQPTTLDYTNGLSAFYTYDARGNMLTHILESSDSKLIDNAFVWDQLSQVDSITDQLANSGERVETSQDFTLENQRLVYAEAESYGGISYAYDVGGRLTEVADSDGDSVAYLYDHDEEGLPVQCGLDQADAASSCPGSSDASVVYWGSYDASGNLTSATSADASWSYTYDPENRLVEAVATESGTASRSTTLTGQYTYDHRGRRIQKIDAWDHTTLYVAPGYEVDFAPEGDGTYAIEYTRYLLSPGGKIAAVTGEGDGLPSGDTTDSAASGTADDPTACSVSSLAEGEAGIPTEGTFFFHQDHLGSTSVVTCSNGEQYSQSVYEPFGVPAVDPVDSDTYRAKFNGKELDEDTWLYYFSSRYYDPQRGRFLSADTRLGGPGPEVQDAWNRYAFALNNPVTHADPTGHSVGSWFKHAAHRVLKWTAKQEGAVLGKSAMGFLAKHSKLLTDIGLGLQVADVAAEVLSGGLATPEVIAEEGIEAGATAAAEGAAESAAESAGGTVGGGVEDVSAAGRAEGGGDLQQNECEGASFSAGTLVATEGGQKPIEDIRVGERVWAWNEATSVSELRRVLGVRSRVADDLLAIEVGGEHLRLTPDHPLWVEGRGWTPAAELEAGRVRLRAVGSGSRQVTAVAGLASSEWVHSLTVSGLSNYLVSSDGFLSHNGFCRRMWDKVTSKLRRSPRAGEESGQGLQVANVREQVELPERASIYEELPGRSQASYVGQGAENDYQNVPPTDAVAYVGGGKQEVYQNIPVTGSTQIPKSTGSSAPTEGNRGLLPAQYRGYENIPKTKPD